MSAAPSVITLSVGVKYANYKMLFLKFGFPGVVEITCRTINSTITEILLHI
jgi:hypothetical protein